VQNIVAPETQSVLRVIFGQLQPEEIFTTQRNILKTVLQEATLRMAEKYIILDDLLIKKITFPPTIKEAIERKLKQEQIALEYDFRLLQAEQEAKRKKIEAQGIRDFQDIVSEGISNQLLRWRGIEATLELSKSPNTKIIIIGGPRDGLPLIMNTGDVLSDSKAGAASGIPGSASFSFDIMKASEAFTSLKSDFNTGLSGVDNTPQ